MKPILNKICKIIFFCIMYGLAVMQTISSSMIIKDIDKTPYITVPSCIFLMVFVDIPLYCITILSDGHAFWKLQKKMAAKNAQ